MSDQKKQAFVVYTNTDLTEGRGWNYPVAVCETEATANRLAKKAYVQGCDAPVEKRELIRVGGEWYGPVRVIPSTKEDDHSQQLLDQRRAALEKAFAAGLSEDDVKALRL